MFCPSITQFHTKTNCNYYALPIGQKQVLDKAAKFMRAHLAQIVEDFSPTMSRELCMQLVEETLELDEWIHSIASQSTSRLAANAMNAKKSAAAVAASVLASPTVTGSKAPLTICPVLFDAKEMFHQWLLSEHRFFYFELRGKCREVRKVFSFDFGDTSVNSRLSDPAGSGCGLMYDATSGSKSGLFAHRNGGLLRCYKGVYECMNLFFIGSERYKFLPPQAQRAFSVCVLEPLLCTALGLLLYKTRSNAVLFQISMGTYKPAPASHAASHPSEHHRVPPEELQEYYDSAHYFQTCLEASARRNLVSHSAQQFRNSLWSELQTWMPQVLISEQDLRNGFSPVDLIDKAWKLSDEFGSADHQYAYRNSSSTSAAAVSGKKSASFLRSGANLRDSSGKLHKPFSGGINEVGEIGECVDVARGLAITLCNVLKEQLANCK